MATRRGILGAAGGLLLPAGGSIAQGAEAPRRGGTLICVLPDEPPTLATWLSSPSCRA